MENIRVIGINAVVDTNKRTVVILNNAFESVEEAVEIFRKVADDLEKGDFKDWREY